MADFFEFEESEIVFSDDSSSDAQTNRQNSSSNPRLFRSRNTVSRWRKEDQCSVPMKIPGNSNSSSPPHSPSSSRYDAVEFGGYYSDEDDENEIVPPHVIVDRRSSGFDSYEKNARKVKNMLHVRNSILKLTGFLEA